MTINSAEKFVKSLWDWGVLDGCFGETKIKPTDIDGFVERNGRFLLFETKGEGVPLTKGQKITFDKLNQTGKFTIIVIWGDPGNPVRMKVMHGWYEDEFDADIEVLRDWVSRWFKWVNKIN